jgi:hypothetical protein
MKTCVVRRRFYPSEAAGFAVTINTEPNFGTPKACMVFYVENAALPDAFDNTTSFRTIGVGFAGPLGDGTTTIQSRCTYSILQDNVSSTGATFARRQSQLNQRLIFTGNTGGAVSWQATGAAFSNEALTVTMTNTANVTNLDCIFTFFTGSELTVGCGDSTFPNTAAGTRAYSGLNFTPDLVFVAASIAPSGTGVTDDFRFAFGAATRSPALQKGIYYHVEPGATSDPGTLSSSNTMITYSTSNVIGPYTQTISNIQSGGWTFTSSDAAIASNTGYIHLALQSSPDDYNLVDFTTFTGTGISFTGTGISSIPECIVGASTNATTSNTRVTTAPGSEGINFFGGSMSENVRLFDGIGTIQTNSAGTLVTGTGTFFLRLVPGYNLYQQNGTLIGTIGNVGTATSCVLTSNAASTLAAGTSFCYSVPGQYCMTFGTDDGVATTAVVSGVSRKLYLTQQISSGLGATLDLVDLNDFDTRPGYELEYLTNSGTSKLGFAVSFRSEQKRRRRGSVS